MMNRTILVTALSLGLIGCGGDDKESASGTGVSAGTGASSAGDGDGDGDGDSAGDGDGDSSGGGDGDGDGDGDSDGDPGTSGGDGDGDGDSDGGSVFIVEPDGGAAAQCDVWNQDCPEGQKCMPWANDGGFSWNATKCTPVAANPNQPGDECLVEGNDVSGVDDCEVGSMCFSVNPETNVGTCVAFCSGSPDAPSCDDPDTSCNISNEGVMILCLNTCDPVIQDCPTGGQQPNGCYLTGDEFLCWPDFSFDNGAYGEPCEYLNYCDVGLYCANPDGVPGCTTSGCCSEFCDLSDTGAGAACAGAAGGQDCIAFYEDGAAPPGLENVGVCAIPV